MRKCKNWLTSFREWTIERSESTEILLFWSGLYTLASTIKRQVYIPESYLGSYTAPPNIYVLFVGPAGLIRKSTTSALSERLLLQLPQVTIPKNITTQARLMEELSKSPDGSISIISSEFSSLIMKSKGDMYEFLTDAYDAKKTLSAATIMRGDEITYNPCVNMIACTTPIWVKANMSEEVIGGGFSSRTMIISENKTRSKMIFVNPNIDYARYAKIEADLVEDLMHIASLSGEFKFDNEAYEFFGGRDGSGGYYGNLKPPNNPSLLGFYARKHIHILKVAQLVHLAYSDELILNKDDLEKSIAIIDQVEYRLPEIYKNLGKNVYKLDMDAIYGYIKAKGKATRTEVFSHFYGMAEPVKLGELIGGLIQAGMILAEVEKDEAIYTSVEI